MHAANDNLLRDTAAEAPGEDAVQNPQVRTLLLTDLCESTLLVERLGDTAAAELFREHDRLVLGLQQRWRGRLIDRSDGLLLLFERAIDGLGFALDYARGLRELGERRDVAKHGIELLARQGLHVGEVLTWRNSDAAVSIGAKPLEVEGLAKPMAGRLMTLARPGQILLSATAEPLAHRAARELGERGEQLLWKDWGRWRFKGVPQGQQVYEVGEPGIAPLRAPQQNRAKAWRDIPLWRRPAALAAELVLVAGLVGGAWFLTKPQPAIAFAERDWVVVGDLRNLTGDTLLDDSLEQAFRISLEQSRYVNVLSDLKARDTLGRMRRKPDTVLDRAIASEIALRDGARAVILPTVAEIGGRVRVSAEVIDPHTQTTVYAASADGSGAGSTLGSIDKVTSELRGKLGEALESIQKNSVSLPNVTTSNLDALKAYAIGDQRYTAGDPNAAIGFYQRAIKLDPGFALAMLREGRAYGVVGDLAAQRKDYERASGVRSRLPPREALQLDAQLATYGPVEPALQRWRELIDLYPDEHYAQFRLAQDGMMYANIYSDSVAHAEAATVTQSAFKGYATYLKGMLLLGLERYSDAISEFNTARQRGYVGAGFSHAYAFAAQRNFAAAEKVLADRKNTGVATAELEVANAKMLFAIDRGAMHEARNLAKDGLEAARATNSPLAVAEWRVRALLTDFLSQERAKDSLEVDLMREVSRLESEAERLDAIFPSATAQLMLGAGYIGARMNSEEVVSEVLIAVPEQDVIGYPVVRQMRQVLQAEMDRMHHKPDAAIALLSKLASEPTAIFPVHASLFSAALSGDKARLEKKEAEWLSKHRGRAYVEHGVDYMTTGFNLVDANSATRFLNEAGAEALLNQP